MINIITMSNGILNINKLFKDTEKAEEFFKEKIRELDPQVSENDLQTWLDEGTYDNLNGQTVILSWPEEE